MVTWCLGLVKPWHIIMCVLSPCTSNPNVFRCPGDTGPAPLPAASQNLWNIHPLDAVHVFRGEYLGYSRNIVAAHSTLTCNVYFFTKDPVFPEQKFCLEQRAFTFNRIISPYLDDNWESFCFNPKAFLWPFYCSLRSPDIKLPNSTGFISNIVRFFAFK